MVAMNAPEALPSRQALYEQMRPHGLAPLWAVLHALVPREPAVRTQCAHWRWSDVEPFLDAAGHIITAEEAVRRVLILENPGWAGASRATSSLFAGLQMILPGEVAPSHRHTQSALRFVVSGQGAYTAVDGERATMAPGDFIITPAWTWHDHGNDGDEAVVWLDGLDIPTVSFFEAGFAENDTRKSQAVTRAEGSSLARFGSGLLPLDDDAPYGATSPVFSVPYARSRAALAQLASGSEADPWFGTALRFTNPLTGGPPMPTIGAWLQLLQAGFVTKPVRCTAGTVFSVVEGAATATLQRGEEVRRFELSPKDHFVLPPWFTLQLQAEESCVLFAFNDAPLQRAAGLYRQERL
jgi:gentisate 1,2-dioxygenase